MDGECFLVKEFFLIITLWLIIAITPYQLHAIRPLSTPSSRWAYSTQHHKS